MRIESVDKLITSGVAAAAGYFVLTLTLACSSTEPDGLREVEEPFVEPGLLAFPPLVGRPTHDSVTLNVVSGELPVELELSLDSPTRATQASPLRDPQTILWGESWLETALEGQEARDLEIEGLAPGTEYRYRLTARGGGRSEVAEGRFVTRREPGSAFSFAVFSDPHLPVPAPEWLDAASAELFLPEIYDYLAARLDSGQILRQAMVSIREHEVDFIVCLGDMLHFYRGFNDPFPTAGVAEYGYRDLRAHLGQAAAEAAFFAVVGNWEGESGWQPERLRRHARQARMKYLPNPDATTYVESGSSGEDYFAWSWGDALLVVLNVVSYTPTKHTLSPDDDGTATDWTLGGEQLAWLEATLEGSRERFKLVFIHHPVGGQGGDTANSAYGRGGGRAARVGEQAAVHRLMIEHGVQIFFYGHDHVFTDLVVDGVHYTLPGSAGAPWKFAPEETGYEDSDDRSGFALVHVGREETEVELLDLEGTVFQTYSVRAD